MLAQENQQRGLRFGAPLIEKVGSNTQRRLGCLAVNLPGCQGSAGDKDCQNARNDDRQHDLSMLAHRGGCRLDL